MMPQRKMVLTVHSSLAFGAARWMLQHALVARDLGFHVHVVLNENGPLEELLKAADVFYDVFPILHFGLRKPWKQRNPIGKLFLVLKSRWDYMRRMMRLLKNMQRPLVHAHSVFCSYAVVAARWARCKIVWHVHESCGKGLEWYLRDLRLSRIPDKVVFVSEAIRRGYTVASEKSRVMYSFVDVPAEVPPRQGNRLEILFVGQLIHRKGVFEFVEICKRLRDRQVPFHATMVGGGTTEMVTAIQNAIQDGRLDESITVQGLVDDVTVFYRASDVFLLPTRNDPAPIVIAEAMAHGLAVVASAVDGIPEMVTKNQTAFLFLPDRLDDAVEALALLGRNLDLCRRMGEAGHERIRQFYSRERYTREFREIYREILGA